MTSTFAAGIGRYPVTLRVVDPAGLFDEQSFAFVITAGNTGVGQNNLPTITHSPAGQIVQDRVPPRNRTLGLSWTRAVLSYWAMALLPVNGTMGRTLEPPKRFASVYLPGAAPERFG